MCVCVCACMCNIHAVLQKLKFIIIFCIESGKMFASSVASTFK